MSVSTTLGKGILSGLAGTAAMTASTLIESKLSDRPPSTTPAEVVEKVVGVEPKGEEEEQRLSSLVHWAYGTGWGVPRAFMSAIGLKEPLATVTHFVAVWGSALVMLPSLRITPPATEWDKEDLLKDGFHHLVYAAAAGLAYSVLDRRERKRRAEAA